MKTKNYERSTDRSKKFDILNIFYLLLLYSYQYFILTLLVHSTFFYPMPATARYSN